MVKAICLHYVSRLPGLENNYSVFARFQDTFGTLYLPQKDYLNKEPIKLLDLEKQGGKTCINVIYLMANLLAFGY